MPDDLTTNVLRILHVEDNDADAELIAYHLRAAWPTCHLERVAVREDLARALRECEFNIVLSDYALAAFNGMDALALVQELQPGVPFLLLSGTIGEERAVEALKAGAIDYVLKDRTARLVPAIRRALADITELRSRRQTEERFRQLAETSQDVFWFADLNPFRVRFVSPAVENIWGLTPEEFYANSNLWLEGVHPEDRVRVEQNFNAWLAGERVAFNEEFRVVRPDGAVRWVLDLGTFTRDPSGKTQRANGVARDITLAKESTEHSLRAQRLESIGLLAGGIAHDLNNALAPILIGLELLRPEVSERDQALFDQMQTSANRGAAMVRQLLGFARGAEGQRASVSPEHAIREVEQLVMSTFPKEIQTAVTVHPRIPNVDADPTLLHQVLLNLCVNARDAMPRGGRLDLEVEAVHIDESYASFIPAAKPGRYVVFKVSDTGSGIPPELVTKIFDPFFTTKPAGVGTGLGLTTVAGITHNHGGFVRVYSELNKGTSFKIYFPAASSEDSAVVAEPEPTAFRANGEGVLIVDDEEPVRLLLKGLLERHGFRVMLTADGTEALAVFATHRDTIKLVLTDERMPHMDGLVLARTLRHMSPEVRVIAMSGLHSETRVRDFAAAGVTHFLHKPFALKELTEAIRACLGTEYLQPDSRPGL